MVLNASNFGGFAVISAEFKSTHAPNGAGKTTKINAYLWVLTGRTLNGFEPRRADAPDTELTAVALSGFAGMPTIRRTLSPAGGTTLHVSGEIVTQADVTCILHQKGVDLAFVATCADANALASDKLDSDALRSLLTCADVIDGGEAADLRKELERLRKARKQAEQYAVPGMPVPERTVEPLSVGEQTFLDTYVYAKSKLSTPCTSTCAYCGHTLSDSELEKRKAERSKYESAINAPGAETEYKRISAKRDVYAQETQSICDARRVLDMAAKAREDVATFTKRIDDITDKLREVDANAVREELPDGITLVTEKASKTGAVRSVCTLTVDGVPLKSVNRAKRIEVCTALLYRARERKGLTDVVPIVVDNAEALDEDSPIRKLRNIILFSVQ